MTAHCSSGDNTVRLINNYSDTIGDVEVFLNNRWIPLCSDSVERREANYICKLLGWESGDVLSPYVFLICIV